METRGKKQAYSEAELEHARKLISDKEAQLHEQGNAIRQERAALEQDKREYLQYREKTENDFEQIRVNLLSKETELSKEAINQTYPDLDNTHPSITDLMNEIEKMRREMEHAKAGFPSAPSCPSRSTSSEPNPSPRVPFREALETVPYYDGTNMSLAQFVRACRRAKDIVPASSEREFTRLLITKLRAAPTAPSKKSHATPCLK